MCHLPWVGILAVIFIKDVYGSCATKEFMPCVVQLNSQKVLFDTNIVHVIYNITTEAKLIHTCRAYERVFPCFSQRLTSCGTKAQRNMLDKGKRLHSYLCAPFSLQRQKIFLKSSTCIRSVLKLPMDSRCEKPESLMAQKLHSCRSKCGDDQVCNTKVDISEVAACSYLKIEKVCGSEAAQFYAQMQQVITNREFPVQCSYTLKGSTKHPIIKPTTTTSKSTTVLPSTSPPVKQYHEVRKKTTPYYYSTSYITVYPEGYSKHKGASRKESQLSKSRTRTFSKLFTPMKTGNMSSIPILPGAPLSTSSVATTRFTFSVPTTSLPPVTKKITVAPAHKLSTPIPPSPYALPLPGARPIPETVVLMSGSPSSASGQDSPLKFQFSVSQSPGGDKFIPWYHNNKEAGSAPTNPMISPFMDVTPSSYPTLIPPIMSNDFPENPAKPEDITPSPFKININWMDGPEESVWYQQNVPTQRKPDKEEQSGPFEVVTPLLNHLKTKPLNFTEMSNQASDYFNAALSALESVADESKAATADNNPWRTFIDAVAPTIHKVSPNIIPRIRQEIERIESQGSTTSGTV